jgi:hypothetical protein
MNKRISYNVFRISYSWMHVAGRNTLYVLRNTNLCEAGS